MGIGSGDTHYVDGPYLHSNDTTGAYAGRALNASCTWLGRNQNVTAGGQLVYQRAFQCTYGMQPRWAPGTLAGTPLRRVRVLAGPACLATSLQLPP